MFVRWGAVKNTDADKDLNMFWIMVPAGQLGQQTTLLQSMMKAHGESRLLLSTRR